mmetsp:Transcript_67884/g.189325  ORF Transcript_67884/g.189325 Transcript_67884/m.189325 type:complete len:237 (+) Transcript_67884:517-1227(+)
MHLVERGEEPLEACGGADERGGELRELRLCLQAPLVAARAQERVKRPGLELASSRRRRKRLRRRRLLAPGLRRGQLLQRRQGGRLGHALPEQVVRRPLEDVEERHRVAAAPRDLEDQGPGAPAGAAGGPVDLGPDGAPRESVGDAGEDDGRHGCPASLGTVLGDLGAALFAQELNPSGQGFFRSAGIVTARLQRHVLQLQRRRLLDETPLQALQLGGPVGGARRGLGDNTKAVVEH